MVLPDAASMSVLAPCPGYYMVGTGHRRWAIRGPVGSLGRWSQSGRKMW
jgi:Cys-tRNA synthase (O-phospho-L-seryl-tRNA:Cys-tRNA synthase)